MNGYFPSSLPIMLIEPHLPFGHILLDAKLNTHKAAIIYGECSKKGTIAKNGK